MTTNVPDHLATLIVSPRAYARQKQILEGFRWLRANNPLGRVVVDGFDSFWLVTRHADILDIDRQHDIFHNGDRASTLVPRAADELAHELTNGSPHVMRALLQMDAPDHAKYRRITQAWFSPPKLEEFAGRIRAIACRSIDRIAALGGTCDFVRDVALDFPLRVLMGILGVPQESEPYILGLTQKLFRSQDDVSGHDRNAIRDPTRHARLLFRIFGDFESYFTPLMDARRRAPCDDLATVIATAEVDGKPISHFEAISYYMLLATGGHHTTSSTISGAVLALCENPDEFRRIKAEPGLIANFVEEAVRWTSPVQHVMRTATEDTEKHGRRIAKGDWLMLSYLSANRDEAAYHEPERFSVAHVSSRTLAFGHGAHVCLGRRLARLEMRIFFEELFRRIASIEITGKPRRCASLYLGGLITLPTRFKMM